MKSFFTIALIFPVVFSFDQCTSSGQSQKQSSDTVTDESKGLKDYYAAYFPLLPGTASRLLCACPPPDIACERVKYPA